MAIRSEAETDPAESKIFLIMGMHRSGTSALAGTLREHGVFLGPVKEESYGNPKGNQEIQDLWRLNDRLLRAAGHSWTNPCVVTKWTGQDEQDRDTLLSNFSNQSCWGIKDPRLLFMLNFWTPALPSTPRLVASFRHPAPVISSLQKRDDALAHRSLSVWKKYNARLLELLGERNIALVCFDVEPADYARRIKSMVRELGLPPREHLDFFESAHRSRLSDSTFPDEESRAIYQGILDRYVSQAGDSAA